MNDKKTIEFFEETAIGKCKEMDNMIKIVDALRHYGYYVFGYNFDPSMAKEEFENGLALLSSAIRKKYAHEIMDCFRLVGVGGEKAKEFAIDEAKKKFGECFEDIEKYIC